MWAQKTLQLKARSRGFHLITDEIEQQLPQIHELSVGLLHLFIQHTSASLTLNENADPTVRWTWKRISTSSCRRELLIISTPMKVMTTCQHTLKHRSLAVV